MLLHLVKKDFLLTKKYWAVMLILAIVLPIFIYTKVNVIIEGGFFPFLLSTLYIVYLQFNTVSMMEYKYRGAGLLCATPYTRKAVVKSKYLYIFAIFIGCYILYTLAVQVSPIHIGKLDLSDFGRTFFIIAVIFGAMIPVQYRFGYEKSRYIFFIMIFLMPFVLPNIMKALQENGTTFSAELPFSQSILGLFLVLLALVIGGISMGISIRIYSSQNL